MTWAKRQSEDLEGFVLKQFGESMSTHPLAAAAVVAVMPYGRRCFPSVTHREHPCKICFLFSLLLE